MKNKLAKVMVLIVVFSFGLNITNRGHKDKNTDLLRVELTR